MALPEWAAQYEDDPALRESLAEKELCETRVWRRDGLDVTPGSTRKFAEAHNSLRRGAAQFYIMNSFVLALPSLLELLFAARNFSSACGWATAAWMTVDSVVCLFGSLLSLWLCLQAQVLQDLELQEHLVRKARGDPELPEELEGKVDNFNKVTRCAVISIAASMLSSLVLWAVGLCMFFFKDLSQCDDVRRWVRLMTWVRVLMPFFFLCCIIPVQQLCCQASCFSRISALKQIADAEDAREAASSASSSSEAESISPAC